MAQQHARGDARLPHAGVGRRVGPGRIKGVGSDRAVIAAGRHQPFQPATITLAAASTSDATAGGPTVMYTKYCANCHGSHGQGAQQGPLKFPPLLDVSSKPRRTVDDIMGLLKDPAAYGLQPPMRPFADKLTKEQMREIAEWIVKLKK